MEKLIKSRWVLEEGQWSNAKRSFINRTKEESFCDIKMCIDGGILEFVGGPTGFERYHIEDMLLYDPAKHPEICICAGTINSWPACFVARQEVVDFLKSFGLARSPRKR